MHLFQKYQHKGSLKNTKGKLGGYQESNKWLPPQKTPQKTNPVCKVGVELMWLRNPPGAKNSVWKWPMIGARKMNIAEVTLHLSRCKYEETWAHCPAKLPNLLLGQYNEDNVIELCLFTVLSSAVESTL